MASTKHSETEVVTCMGQGRSTLATTSSKQDGSRVSCPNSSDPTISVQHTDITSVAYGVFPCVLCSESFADGLALAVHERSHSQSPALHCPVCGRSFSLPGDLHRHRRRHERRGGIADNRSEAIDGDRVPVPLRSNEQGTQTTKVAEKSSITQVSVVCSADASGVSAGILSTGTAVARTVWDRPSEDKQCTSKSVRAGSLTPPKKKHTKLMEKNRRLSEVSRASASDIDMQEGMSGNSTVSGTVESSEATSDALESPFQCAICRARFCHVSSLQKHVEGHVQTESRQPVKKAPPRRSQRSRPAKRRAGVGETIDNGIDLGSDDAGSCGRNDSDVSGKPLDGPPVAKKRLCRGRKDPGQAVMSRSVKGGSKVGAQTALSSTAEAGSVSNPESGTSANLELATSASEIQAAVSVQNSKEDVSAAQPAIEQSTATKFLQPSLRRRTSRAIIPLVMDEESYVDDAPAVSPRTQPPSALSGTKLGAPPGASNGGVDEAAPLSTLTPLSTPPPMVESTEGSAVEGQEVTTSSEAEAVAPVKCPEVPGQFKCDVCGRRLAHRHALARHRRLHFARENFQCDKCPRRYSRFDSLVTHSRKHATEATHKCQICSKAYRLRSLLEYHQREHKNEDVPPAPVAETPRFECAECGKTFSFMTALRRHARLHLGTKHFFCELCPKRYSRFDALVLHARAHSLLTPFECVICARSFSQRQILEYHVRAHAGAVDGAYPPFNCTMCGRSFPDVAQLREHRLRHSATRSYLCDMCGKAFKSANKLRRHVMTHTGERPLTCKVCERRFVDSTSLTQHMRIHSGERPFQCHVCGKSFSRNVTLKIHGRTHSGERPHPCEICGRAFTTITQLRRHGRVHSGERPYICTVCGRAFSQATHRKVHMRTHAPRPDDAVDGQQPLLWLQQPLPAALQQPQQQQEQQQSQQQQQQQQQHSQQQQQQEKQLHQQQEKQQQLTAPASGHQEHQQSQEHSQLYTLHEGLQAVAPLQLEEGNVPLHFLEH